jgi:hypothetical protein
VKRPKTRQKPTGKKISFPQLFRPKVFDMDFPQNVFFGVFELPLLRNAQKRHKQKLKKLIKKTEGTYLPHLVVICQIYVAFKKNLSASRSEPALLLVAVAVIASRKGPRTAKTIAPPPGVGR